MHKSLTAFLSVISITTLLTACTPSTPTGDTGEQSSGVMMEQSSSTAMMEPGADGTENDDAIMEPGADGQEDDNDVQVDVDAGASVDVMTPRVIAISAKNFTFSPNAISVKKGEKVTLRLTGVEGNHGFGIPELGVNTAISEGKTVDVELPTDKSGTFAFKCSVPCGPGHRDMTGTITISE